MQVGAVPWGACVSVCAHACACVCVRVHDLERVRACLRRARVWPRRMNVSLLFSQILAAQPRTEGEQPTGTAAPWPQPPP